MQVPKGQGKKMLSQRGKGTSQMENISEVSLLPILLHKCGFSRSFSDIISFSSEKCLLSGLQIIVGSARSQCFLQVFHSTLFLEVGGIRSSQVALVVNNLPVNAGGKINVGLIPGLGRYPGGRHGTHSCILACIISWTEESGKLQFMGSQRVRHDWVTKHICTLQIYCKYLLLNYL